MASDEIEQLERAIASLEAQRATLGDTVTDTMIAPAREKLAALQARAHDQQRKLVTCLFADVVNSSKTFGHLDPEDTFAILSRGLDLIGGVIKQHEGYVARLMGDGLLAFFGTPLTREDDAERAVRAGLAIVAAAQAYGREVESQWGIAGFNVRVGLNTGLVALGTVGGEAGAEFTAMGDAVNMAARMESNAPAGGMLISQATYQHVRGLFEVNPLEPILVKGALEPFPVYTVLGNKARAFRPGTRGIEGIETEMIGREAELRQLQDGLYTAVEDRELQMVTVAAEAGLGKSRLLYEFCLWADRQDTRLWYFKGRAGPSMQSIPYSLLRDLFAFRFQIQDSDSLETVQAKMELGVGAFIAESQRAQMMAHFIGYLLGYPFEASPHLCDVWRDAAQVRDRAGVYIAEYFKALTADHPVAILLEDIHWGDDHSLDLVLQLAKGLAKFPLLIVCATRPTLFERRAHWGEGQTFHTRLDLRPLSKRDSRHLVEAILQRVKGIPAELSDLIVSSAEGNPFYVEELVKMLIEENVILKGEERWQIDTARIESVRVPATLTGVLQARFDSLPSRERLLLQRASVIGRVFWDGAVVDDLAADVGHLERLRGREMIFQREQSAFEDSREYIFKHALLRDVTYESVLKRERRRYHGSAARWLTEVTERSGRADEFAALIADHFDQAGETEQAGVWYGRAGKQAAARFATADAMLYLTKALERLPDSDLTTRYDLLLVRQTIHMKRGAVEARAHDLALLQGLADALEDSRRQAEVMLQRSGLASQTNDFALAIEYATQAVGLAEQAGAVELEVEVRFRLGSDCRAQGEFILAIEQLERAYANSKPFPLLRIEILCELAQTIVVARDDFDNGRAYLEQALELSRHLNNPKAAMAIFVAFGKLAEWEGKPVEAEKHFHEALRLAREIGDYPTEGEILGRISGAKQNQGSFAEANAYLYRRLQLALETEDHYSEETALAALAWNAICCWDYTSAMGYTEQLVALCRALGDSRGELLALDRLAHLADLRRDYVALLHYNSAALALARESRARSSEAYFYRVRGLICYQYREPANVAQSAFEDALVVARETGSILTETMALWWLAKIAEEQDDSQAAGEYRQQLGQIQSKDSAYALNGEQDSLGGWLAQLREEYDAARRYYERAIPLLHESENQLLLYRTYIDSGIAAFYHGHYDAAEGYLRQALGVGEALKTRVMETNILMWLACSAQAQGLFDEAQTYLNTALEVMREIGDDGIECQAECVFSLLDYFSGDNAAAAGHARKAVEVAQTFGQAVNEMIARLRLAHALRGLGELDEAEAGYREVIETCAAMRILIYGIEARAGLAAVLLQQGQIAEAVERVEQILAFLESRSLDGADDPVGIYVIGYYVLQAAGDDRAAEFLDMGYALLQARAARIADDTRRESYLTNVPSHRELLSLRGQ